MAVFHTASTRIPDPTVSGTKVLHLHMNGVNDTNVFTDETGKTWTSYGDAKLSTTSPKFGTAAGYFDGTAGISTPYIAALALSTGTWMLDFWVRPDSVGSDQDLIAHRGVSDNANFWFVRLNASGQLRTLMKLDNAVVTDVLTSSTIPQGEYTHVRIVGVGRHIDGVAINGVFDTLTGTNGTGAAPAPAVELWVGCGDNSVANGLVGREDEVLLVKGGTYAVTNFTVPTLPWA